MHSSDFLDTIKKIHHILNGHSFFTVSPLKISPPIPSTVVTKFQKDNHLELPSLLQEIFIQECSGVNFLWRTKKEKAQELGYNINSYIPSGNIELLSPQKIQHELTGISEIYGEDSIAQGLIPVFRDNLAGDLYCLDTTQKENGNIPIVALFLESDPDRKVLSPNFETFFLTWSEVGFIGDIDRISENGIQKGDPDYAQIIRILSE